MTREMPEMPSFAEQLRAMTWGTVNIDDTVIGQICPACSALVAPGARDGAAPYRTHHIEYHAANDWADQ